ncbi:hypothetical protein GCM10023311_01330 [Flaviramulus aquimarinus]|uniref:DUF4382 domain-containing protein n=1 Tax=Flaviramulus aquimarinus TaxID=1170456 RepID=A0ABP9ENB7_9FLAO
MTYSKFIAQVFSILFLIVVSSCNIEPFEGDIPEQETQPDGNTNSGNAIFKVDFDGGTFEADNSVATVINDVINITGIKTGTNEAIVLTLFGNTEGTYQLGVAQNQVEINGAIYNTNITGTGDTWIAVTDFVTSQGEVTVSEIDEVSKTISGTFFFTGHSVSMSSKEFVSGVFTNVSFEEDLVSGSENTFFAKVDGVEFVEDAVNGVATSLPGLSTIGISATKNSLETIGLSFDSDIDPGDYEFSSLSIPLAQYSLSLSDSNLGEGAFKIISHDKANKRIVGSFQFIASPFLGTGSSYEITEGSFDVTYL